MEFTQGTRSSVVLSSTNYAHFLKRLLEELRPEVALRCSTIELEGEAPEIDLPLDPRRLRRVFFNIVSNSTDAMPSGGKIFIRFRVSPKEVVTEIQDSGSGIAPEIAGQLFEAFATHGKAHGTGLGLSISKKIVEDHRGWIKARNDAGKGAVFSFGLPR